MLERLQKKKSNYDVVKWQQEERDRQKLLNRMQLMPSPHLEGRAFRKESNSNSPETKTFELLSKCFLRGYDSNSHRQILEQSIKHNLSSSALHHDSSQIVGSQIRPYINNDLDLTRTVLYKKGINIDNKHYICEISHNELGFTIALTDIEGSTGADHLSLLLKHTQKTELMFKAFDYDFNELVKHIFIRNGSIFINNQVKLQQYLYPRVGAHRSSPSKASKPREHSNMLGPSEVEYMNQIYNQMQTQSETQQFAPTNHAAQNQS